MKQIEILETILRENNIPYEVTTLFSAPQIWYPNSRNSVCDVISHFGCYGYEKGLLEIMGLTENDEEVEGYLTGEEIARRIIRDFEENKEEILALIN